jgi:hypothetical protein
MSIEHGLDCLCGVDAYYGVISFSQSMGDVACYMCVRFLLSKMLLMYICVKCKCAGPLGM